MTVVWRPGAEEEFRAAIRYLRERNDKAAAEMVVDMVDAVRRLEVRPRIARSSQYPGFLVWSLPKWKKILIFCEAAEVIEVAALLDARQLPPKAIK